jgi:Domain of unknown function DUF11
MKKFALAATFALALQSVSPSEAHAARSGADLVPTIVPPTSTLVGDVSDFDIRIVNRGNRDSQAVSVVVQLPVTRTSPTVHVLGQVTGMSSGCQATGTRITCSIASIRKGATAIRRVSIKLPYSVAPIAVGVSTSTANEINAGNNNTSFTVAQSFWEVLLPGNVVTVDNLHCTGTNLSSYYECSLYPSSINSHFATFTPVTATSGTLDFNANGPGYEAYGGTWSVSGSELTFEMTENGVPIGNFVGRGVDLSCWEGKTTFTAGGESMYRVCL